MQSFRESGSERQLRIEEKTIPQRHYARRPISFFKIKERLMKQFTCISDLLGLPVLCLGNNIHILVELELTNERLYLYMFCLVKLSRINCSCCCR